ncbi:hypothetical protein FHT21_002703 [Pedobacter sp. SG908]|nr:hypothetical protein [Pedobacter sp. SG908]NMN37518.1 hypothetical protein [Pedobacter sp. SG918]
MGLWEEEREEVMQLAVGNFQFTLLNFCLVFPDQNEHDNKHHLVLPQTPSKQNLAHQ